MATEVVLNKDVSGLGIEGDIVNVTEGYARNYLFPQKLATLATSIAKKKLEKIQVVREARREQDRGVAQVLAAKLADVSCTISVKVGDNNHLYGSVTAMDIIASLEKQGVTLDKNQIAIAEPIKALGTYTVPLKLHADVAASIKVWVVEEKV
jgi:large subunit ribosomal protein L9